MRHVFSASLIAALSLVAVSCSSGPRPPKPGTPAFYWSAAQTTFNSGDFLKANDNLLQLTKSDNEFAAQAQPWCIMLSAGISKAYTDMADNFEAGAKQNRQNPGPFRRQASLFQKQAATYAMECVESAHKFIPGDKSDPISLALPFPSGSAAEPAQLQRIAKGILFPDSEIESLSKSMVKRGVLLSVTQSVGAGEDSAKALEMFKSGDVKVPRAVFLLATAKSIQQQAELFTRNKLDQPERVTIFCDEAQEALKAVPESKETKDLAGKIAKMRKPAKKS
jgi:hypothetical protein